MVAVLVDGLEALTEICSVCGGLSIVNVVESDSLVAVEFLDVDTAAVCASLTFLDWAVEPDNGIKA